jgi:hypothetical protein
MGLLVFYAGRDLAIVQADAESVARLNITGTV